MSAVLARVVGALVRLDEKTDLPTGSSTEPPKGFGAFLEAIGWHRHRDRMLTRQDYDELDEALRQRAFTVAGLAQLDLILEVHRAIDRAVAKGTTLEDFKKDVGEQLEQEWETGGRHASLENVFRTNVQTAYGAGRYQQARQVADYRPYWQFDAIEDVRTSPWCRPLGGVIRRYDDPWWRTHVPPLHFQCRSSIRTLNETQAAREGITPDEDLPKDEAGGELRPQDGFGAAPDHVGQLATDLRSVAIQRVAAARTESPEIARAAEQKLFQPPSTP